MWWILKALQVDFEPESSCFEQCFVVRAKNYGNKQINLPLSYFDQNWSSEIKGSIFSVKNPSTNSDFKEIFGWFWLLFFLLKHIPLDSSYMKQPQKFMI